MTEQFIVGIVSAPFGLDGFVKVKPLSNEIEHLLKLRAVTLRHHGEERSANIEESAPMPPVIVMRFAGYGSPEAAKELAGAELLARREDAAPLRPGEFYVEDLKGASVFAAETGVKDGQALGHITAIIEGGGGDLAEIKLNNGALKLVPFRKEFFPEIYPEKKCILLNNLWILE